MAVLAVCIVLLPVALAQEVSDAAVTLPTARSGVTAVALNGDVYLFGGRDSDVIDRIFRYDGDTQSIEVRSAVLPGGREHMAGATDGTYIYLFGGNGVLSDQSRGNIDEILRYDPDADEIQIQSMRLPAPRFVMSAVWDGSAALLFGGQGIGGRSNLILRYDPAQDGAGGTVPRVGLELPSARAYTAAAWDGSRAYILGGRDNGGPIRQIVTYEPAPVDALGILNVSLPQGLQQGGAVWTGRDLIYAGGLHGSEPQDELWHIDPTNGTIESSEPFLPSGRYDIAAAWTGTQLVVAGGIVSGQTDRITLYEPPSPAQPPVTATDETPEPTGTEDTNGGTPGPDDEGGPLVPSSFLPWIMGSIVLLAAVAVAFAAIRRAAAERPARPGKPRSGRPLAAGGPAIRGAALATQGLAVDGRGGPRLEPVHLEVPSGSLTLLVGPSGSGKSTLLRAIVGLVPARGTILLDGGPARRAELSRRIGFVPQDLQLYEHLSPLDNAVYMAGQFGIKASAAKRRAKVLFHELGLSSREKQQLATLSGGEQRRASVACALVHDPGVLVLDEPSSGLDFGSRKVLWDLLQRLARHHGVAVLATTHFLDDAQYADRVGMLHGGRLVAMDSPRGLLRLLPGAGRCVEVEFEDLPPARRAKLADLLPKLRSEAGVTAADHRSFSARYFARDPVAASRRITELLHDAGLHPRSVRVADLTLEDVFVALTGKSFEEGAR